MSARVIGLSSEASVRNKDRLGIWGVCQPTDMGSKLRDGVEVRVWAWVGTGLGWEVGSGSELWFGSEV